MYNTFSLTGEVIDTDARTSKKGNDYLVLHIQQYQAMAKSDSKSYYDALFEMLVYGDLAKLAQKELTKGTLVVVQGRLTAEQREYNKSGRKTIFYSTSLTVLDYSILGTVAVPKSGKSAIETVETVSQENASSVDNQGNEQPVVPKVSKEEIKAKVSQNIETDDKSEQPQPQQPLKPSASGNEEKETEENADEDLDFFDTDESGDNEWSDFFDD